MLHEPGSSVAGHSAIVCLKADKMKFCYCLRTTSHLPRPGAAALRDGPYGVQVALARRPETTTSRTATSLSSLTYKSKTKSSCTSC